MISRSAWHGFGLAILLGFTSSALAREADEPEPTAPGSSPEVNEAQAKQAKSTRPKIERATFGGGCFWCLEAVFERVPGVHSVVSGYSGGSGPRPTYGLVSTGLTGHAEVVRITYDPAIISFEQLLDLFWLAHDPTTLNRQGPDSGTQYRSIILFEDESQRQATLRSYQDLTQARAFASPIVTQLAPLRKFYPAEKHHQDYFRKNPADPYCQTEIVPKLRKLEHRIAILREEARAKALGRDSDQGGQTGNRPEAPGASR